MSFRRLVLAASALLLAVATQPAEGAPRTSNFDRSWLDAVVSIEVNVHEPPSTDCPGGRTVAVPIGTGFLLQSPREHVLLVTAKHVAMHEALRLPGRSLAFRLKEREADALLIPEEKSKARGLGDWFLADGTDLACRFIVMNKTSAVRTIPFDALLEQEFVDPGAPVVVLGFPHGLRSEEHPEPIVRRGIVARCDPTRILVDAFIFPGNSGGPVVYAPIVRLGTGLTSGLLNEPKVIGVVVRAISETGSGQNIGLAWVLPVAPLRGLVERADVAALDASLSRPPNP